MVSVVFSGDRETLDEAVQANPDAPIKLRVQPQLQVKGIGYLAWRKVSWVFTVKDIAEALAFREALTLFFRVVAVGGMEQTCTGLRGLLDRASEGKAE